MSVGDLLNSLTIIIPHHDQRDKLLGLLEDLSDVKNIVIVKGGTFSRNCNRGFQVISTKFVCFLNDDVRIKDLSVFLNMVELAEYYGVVGCLTESGYNGCILINKKLYHARANHLRPRYPSGCCIVMQSKIFSELNGFDEVYINGHEDMDLYLRAEQEGYKIGISGYSIFHHEASSKGRFDFLDHNEVIFNERWVGVCECALNILIPEEMRER